MRGAIVQVPIDPAALVAEVAARAHGATTLFVGTVRDANEGRPVAGLEYSTYAAMANRELADILGEVAARWPAAQVACEHRTGALEVGEVAVAVAAAAPHRDEAFAACRHVIEELKRRVPIWKQERYADGRERWLGGAATEADVSRGAP